VALTGILATMPYIALQLLGIRALLSAMGVPPTGLGGDLVLTLTFAILALATYRAGLRAPALISVLKGVLVFGVTLALVAIVPGKLGGTDAIFAATPSPPLAPGLSSAYSTLALGSALALLVYPHVMTCTFAARSADTVRRNCVLLPAWTAVLGLLAMLGVAATAAGVQAPPGRGELALPLLVADLLPQAATGIVFGALAIGALVPAAIMSVATANLFTRNVYVEFLHPAATPEHQMQVARLVSVVVKVGALVFVLGLRTQDAINLQLLGGVWILQTFPAVALALFTRRLHRVGLLAGWAAGMAAGTTTLALNGFVSVVAIGDVQIYTALLALGLNLAVAAALTPMLDRLGVPRGLDTTGTDALAAGTAFPGEWLGASRS
jgi:solute:Na+ symporter, SSS family